MGIIGTVMGLISVLSNISNPDEVAPAIAVAFVATLYGVSFANLVWLNFGKKIKTKAKQEKMLNEIIVEGLLSIQAGENPRILREKIGGILPEGKQQERQAGEAASATIGG